jgi:hypothetical protein
MITQAQVVVRWCVVCHAAGDTVRVVSLLSLLYMVELHSLTFHPVTKHVRTPQLFARIIDIFRLLMHDITKEKADCSSSGYGHGRGSCSNDVSWYRESVLV